MELRESIENRRSIRKYKSDEVSRDLVYEIIKEATHAPSGHNVQPWRFKIVSTEEKNMIGDTLYNKYINSSDVSRSHTGNLIKEIPLLVVVYRDSESNRDIDLLSIGAIVDEILLLGEEAGLGTLWMANTNSISDEIKDITGINLETVSTIGFGYKDQTPHKRPRKDISEIIL